MTFSGGNQQDKPAQTSFRIIRIMLGQVKQKEVGLLR